MCSLPSPLLRGNSGSVSSSELLCESLQWELIGSAPSEGSQCDRPWNPVICKCHCTDGWTLLSYIYMQGRSGYCNDGKVLVDLPEHLGSGFVLHKQTAARKHHQ